MSDSPKVHDRLSQGVEVLARQLDQAPGGDAPDFDVLIVGSGYGGSVAAARLAGTHANGRALRVGLLERGREYAPGDFPQALSDLPAFARVNPGGARATLGDPSGLFDLRLSADMNVLVGNGLGGGSLINAGVMAQPHATIFANGHWPASIRLPALQASYERVHRMIRPQPIPPGQTLSQAQQNAAQAPRRMHPPKTLAMRRLADGNGVSAQYCNPEVAVSFASGIDALGVQHNACIQCGDCFSGCNYGAKRTLDRNYLVKAFQQGAQIFTGVTVSHVSACDPANRDGGWLVHVSVTDPALRRALPPLRPIRCARVILAAGTLGSTEILMRSRGPGLRLSSRLGQGFSGNGDLIAVGPDQVAPVNAIADPTLAAGKRGVGPTIASMVDLRDHVPAGIAGQENPPYRKGQGPVIQELAAPALLQWFFAELAGNAGFLHRFSQGNPTRRQDALLGEPISVSPQRMGHHQIYAVFGPEESKGALKLEDAPCPGVFDAIDGRVTVDWPQLHDADPQSLFTRNHALLRRMIQDSGLGSGLLANPQWEPFAPSLSKRAFGSRRGAAITVHALGGCGMADKPSAGVVNAWGQVFGALDGSNGALKAEDVCDDTLEPLPGLVVLDGSIIPTGLGINPAMTIAALAEHALDHLIGQWQLQAPRGPALQSLRSQPTLSAGQGLPAAVTEASTWMISERLVGRITPPAVPGRPPGRARLSLELSIGPMQDVFAFTDDPLHALPIQTARLGYQDDAVEPGTQEPAELMVRGEVHFVRKRPSGPAGRRLRALAALLGNGALPMMLFDVARSELRKLARRPLQDVEPYPGETGPLESILRVGWKLLSVLGEQREFHYEMIVRRDFFVDSEGRPLYRGLDARKDRHPGSAVTGDGLAAATPHEDDICLFRQGDRLIGKKVFTVAMRGNPWWQFTHLTLYLQRAGEEQLHRIGQLKSDLSYFVNFNTYLTKLVRQGDMTSSLSQAGSLISFFARAILGAHLLTLRRPRYQVLPEAAFAPQASAAQAFEGVFKATHPLIDVAGQAVPTTLAALHHFWPAHEAEPASSLRARVPVLAIHGLGAAANTFTQTSPGNGNLVSQLIATGFDPWLVDLRTSPAGEQHESYVTLDEVGRTDVVNAIDTVLSLRAQMRKKQGAEEPGQAPETLSIVAHCIGSPMLMVPLLQGDPRIRHRIRSLVLTQVGLVIELTAYNFARNALIATLRPLVPRDYFDTRVTTAQAREALGTWPTANQRGIPANPPMTDWLFSSFCYRDDEWWKASSWWRRPAWLAQYHRMSVLYAPLMNLKQMRRQTLNDLHRLIGGVNIGTYSQVLYYSQFRRSTDHHGRVLASVKALAQALDFPVYFLSGADNRVFHPSGAQRSAQLLANARAQASLPSSGTRDLYWQSLPGFGHQDLWLGKDAGRQVLPRITDFLKGKAPLGATKASPQTLQAIDAVSGEHQTVCIGPRTRTAHASVLGPTIGWLRKAPNGWTVRVQFVWDRVARAPETILAFVDRVPASGSAARAGVSGFHVFDPAALLAFGRPQGLTVADPLDAQGALDTDITYLEIPIEQAWLQPGQGAGPALADGVQVFLISIHDDEPIDHSGRHADLPDAYFDALAANGPAGQQPWSIASKHAPALWDWLRYRLPDKAWVLAHHRHAEVPPANGFSRDQTHPELAEQGFAALDRLQQFPALRLSLSTLEAADRTPGVGATSDRLSFALLSCQSPTLLVDEAVAGASYRRLAERLDIAEGRFHDRPSSEGPTAPAFVLAVGDQVYMDAGVTRLGKPTGLSVYETPYRDWLGHPAMRSVFSRIPLYPMLDDHEFCDGYVPALKMSTEDQCLSDLYQAYQRRLAPNPGGPSWYMLDKGGFPFFVLDTRSERGNRHPPGSVAATGSQIISPAQMKALKAWLLQRHREQRGTPIFVVSPSVVFPMHRHVIKAATPGQHARLDPLEGLYEDSWDGYPDSLDELLHFIAKERIENLVFLSGDYHLSCVARMQLRCSASETPVQVTSIVSSGSYVPFRATVGQRRALALGTDWLEGARYPVYYRYSTDESMITDAHNVALITARRAAPGHDGPGLSITFDTSNGPLRQHLTLAGAGAPRSAGSRQRHGR